MNISFKVVDPRSFNHSPASERSCLDVVRLLGHLFLSSFLSEVISTTRSTVCQVFMVFGSLLRAEKPLCIVVINSYLKAGYILIYMTKFTKESCTNGYCALLFVSLR